MPPRLECQVRPRANLPRRVVAKAADPRSVLSYMPRRLFIFSQATPVKPIEVKDPWYDPVIGVLPLLRCRGVFRRTSQCPRTGFASGPGSPRGRGIHPGGEPGGADQEPFGMVNVLYVARSYRAASHGPCVFSLPFAPFHIARYCLIMHSIAQVLCRLHCAQTASGGTGNSVCRRRFFLIHSPFANSV